MKAAGRFSGRAEPDVEAPAGSDGSGDDGVARPAAAPNRKPTFRFRRWEPFYWGIGSVVVVSLLWEYVARAGIVSRVFISSPSELWGTFVDMFFITGDVWYHLGATGRIWSTG